MSIQEIVKKINKKDTQWKKDHPHRLSPWSATSFSTISGERIWLNPEHQNYLNYGWKTESELEEWLNGIPGKIIKSQEHWDELLYIETYGLNSVAYLLKHFNNYPAEFCKPNGFPKVKQTNGKLTRKMIQCVESYVKWLYKDWTNYDDLERWNPSIHLRHEINGFFYALTLSGLETRSGICNNYLEARENFTWWKYLLEHEAHWDYVRSQGNAFEPWLKYGCSIIDRENNAKLCRNPRT